MLSLRMGSNVGAKASNKSKNVFLVLALLNAYARKEKIAPLPQSKIVNEAFIAQIKLFQTQVLKMPKPDGIVSANLGTFKALVEYLKTCHSITSITKPTEGILTWDAEGQEGGKYHSRIFHVPSTTSGLTIGRGYDMKKKTATAINNDLVKAGIEAKIALKISKAAGKNGSDAKLFIIENDLLDFEISSTIQLKLFNIIYKELEKDVQRISSKSDTVLAYGKVDWSKLNKAIKTVLVDLRFRGDYTSSSRKKIQKFAAENDLTKFKAAINNLANWAGVPVLRKTQRTNFLSTAIASTPKIVKTTTKSL